MLDIHFGDERVVVVAGRLDASEAERAQAFLDQVGEGPCVIDVRGLEYISSAGLGVLLKTHKRLMASGSGISLVQVNPHISDIFKYSGMDKLFSIKLSTDS